MLSDISRPAARLTMIAAIVVPALAGCAPPKLNQDDQAAADVLDCMRKARQAAIHADSSVLLACDTASGTYRFSADPGINPHIRNLTTQALPPRPAVSQAPPLS